MVKVDLNTAKPLRREEWGWGGGGVETKVGRRKKAGCFSGKSWSRAAAFSHPSSPTYCVTLDKALSCAEPAFLHL